MPIQLDTLPETETIEQVRIYPSKNKDHNGICCKVRKKYLL